MMAHHLSPGFLSVKSERNGTLLKKTRDAEKQARRKTLEEPGAFDTLTASLADLLRSSHSPISEPQGCPRIGGSLPPSPPQESASQARDTWVGPVEMGARPMSAQACVIERDPPKMSYLSSAPIRIVGRQAVSPYGAHLDSFALESPQSAPMVRTISNALSSQPTSYAPSRYLSCEYSECGSYKPTIDSVMGSSASRRMSSDQPGRARMHLLREHLGQNTRPPSTERKALLDAWRCADMDPPNGAREDGTEHFAFLTDEELQLAQAVEADAYSCSQKETIILTPATTCHGFQA